MIPIYVIHYDKLVERREYLEKVLPQAHFITKYGRDSLAQSWFDNCYLEDEARWHRHCMGLYRECPPFSTLTKGMISCGIGHAETWDLVHEINEPALILEDDAILCNNFDSHFKEAWEGIQKLPDWDVVFIGGAFPDDICKTLGKKGNLLLKDHPASNTVCAYIIRPEAAANLYQKIYPFTLPIDFAMNYWMKKLSMKVWHVVPYIIREGTSAGFYKSSQVRA
jgi:GR25 family glycosyltransferase involved in LPS biosynthesis